MESTSPVRDRQDHGQKRQWQCDHDAGTEQFADRHRIGVARAEVAFEKAADPCEIAPPDRLVEAKLGMERSECFRLRIDTKDHGCRITRQHLHQQKDDDGSRKRRQQERDQPPGYISQQSDLLEKTDIRFPHSNSPHALPLYLWGARPFTLFQSASGMRLNSAPLPKRRGGGFYSAQ